MLLFFYKTTNIFYVAVGACPANGGGQTMPAHLVWRNPEIIGTTASMWGRQAPTKAVYSR